MVLGHAFKKKNSSVCVSNSISHVLFFSRVIRCDSDAGYHHDAKDGVSKLVGALSQVKHIGLDYG